MDLQLAGKTAIITGGAKGIGEAITRLLINEGARVAIIDKDKSSTEELVADLKEDTNRIHTSIVDLKDLNALKDSVQGVLDWSNHQIDFLVNNAGINDAAGIEDGIEPFLHSLERNLHHVFALVHYCLPYLKVSKGCIINISSKVASTGQGKTSGYAAAKGAVNALTREWALELAKFGIRVNSIAPAEVYTPLYENWLSLQEDPVRVKSQIEKQIPLENRMTTTQEIANMAVFLLSPVSSHTTGQIVYPDGGYTHLDRACTADLHF
jgi:L-fucose dehydrogenase